MQVSGNVGSQLSTRGVGTHREEEADVGVVAPGLGGKGWSAETSSVVVAAVAQAVYCCIAKRKR